MTKGAKTAKILTLFYLISIFVVSFLIYSNTFQTDFIFDDRTTILDNQQNLNIRNIGQIYKSTPLRFVTNLTFSLNLYLGKLNPVGFHLVNFVFHLCCSFLVYFLATSLIKLSFPKLKNSNNILISFFISLFFAIHPVQTQAVSYISQRYTLIAAFFYLLTLYLYLVSRVYQKTIFYLFSLVTFVLALFSKEISFTIPLSVILIDYIFISKNVKKLIKSVFYIIPFFLILFAVYIIATRAETVQLFSQNPKNLVKVLPSARQKLDIKRQEYLFTQFGVITKYINLLFLPINQNADYDYPIYKSFFDIKVSAPFIFLLLLFVLSALMIKKNRLFSFGILFFFITLSIESSIIPIEDVINEHRMYLPSFAFLLALVALFIPLWLKYKKIFKQSSMLIICSLSFVICFFSFLTYKRNNVWISKLNFWTDVVKKSSQKPRAYYNLGIALIEKQDYKSAIKEFEKAISLDKKYYQSYNNLCSSYSVVGENEKALECFQKAISQNPDNDRLRYNFALYFAKEKNWTRAIQEYEKVLALKPDDIDTLEGLAKVYLDINNPDMALYYLYKIIEIDESCPNAYFYLGLINEKKGSKDVAIKFYQKALNLNSLHLRAKEHLFNLQLNLQY